MDVCFGLNLSVVMSLSWFAFFMLVILDIAILLIPALPLRYLGFSIPVSIGVAPLVAIAALCIIGVFYEWLGLRISTVGMVASLAAVCATVVLLTNICWRFYSTYPLGLMPPKEFSYGPRSTSAMVQSSIHCANGSPVSMDEVSSSRYKFNKGSVRKKSSELDCHSAQIHLTVLMLYVLVGFLVSIVIFVSSLDGPESFVQYSDNLAHMGRIKTMSVDGQYSILNSGYYPLDLSSESCPLQGTRGFYPAAFSLFASLGVGMLNCSVPAAENAVLLVFMAFVYPAGSYLLHSVLFQGRGSLILAGAFTTMMFVAFPFGLLLYGPLYPNMASMCCAPQVAFLFISVWSIGRPIGQRVLYALHFVIASIALAALQPNTVFLLAVFLAPFCCHSLYELVSRVDNRKSFASKAAGFAAGLAFAIFTLFVWVFCFKLPSFESVVTFNWESLYSIPYGVWTLLSLALRRNLPQYCVAILVLMGFLLALRRDDRWLAAAYAIMGTIYVVGISTEGISKQLLAGFWYTDPHRTAASITLLAAPLASLALGTISKSLYQLFPRKARSLRSVRIGTVIVLSSILSYANVMLPNYGYPQRAFHEAHAELTMLNIQSEDKLLTRKEDEFLKRVAELAGEDVVLNNPFDGSVFGYSLYGINVFYKSFLLDGETSDSSTLHEHTHQYGSNRHVQDAVARTGVRYVLVMDTENFKPFKDEVLWSPYTLYPFASWDSFEKISPSDPSFSLVLDDGENRLYELV